MTLITIDPSLNSTAMIIDNKIFSFVNEIEAFTKNGKLSKWFDKLDNLVEFNFIKYKSINDYSADQINKLLMYDDVTNKIIKTILSNINYKSGCKVFIEGYSYSSNAGPLIDLVTFSTLLRKKLYEITNLIYIWAPTTLKLEAAKLSYSAIPIGKKIIKYEYRNNQGVAGGKFQKSDIMKAIIENKKLNSPYINFLRNNSDEILKNKNIPKPIDDINDAQILFNINENL